MSLTNQQLRHLRGLSHRLQPVVTVAGNGLTESVISEIDTALDHHELIKVKLRSDRETRKTWSVAIAKRCSAERIHVIGQVACFFRRNNNKPVIELTGGS
jgi:RNA-binding protein